MHLFTDERPGFRAIWMRYLVPLAAVLCPAVSFAGTTRLPPQDAAVHCSPTSVCTQPTVDGLVAPLEYADGKKFVLQDYVNGGANGTLFLMLSDNAAYTSDECNSGPPRAASIPATQTNPCTNRTLFLGMRVPRPTSVTSVGGSLTVFLDSLRGDTLAMNLTAHLPRSEDRRITFSYQRLESTPIITVQQSMGDATGAWVDLAMPFNAWPVTHSASLPAADPGFVHIEMAIRLFTLNAVNSEPFTSRHVGFALRHFQNVDDGANVGFPNDPVLGASSNQPLTWETLDFAPWIPIPFSLAMWNVGQMPAIIPVSDGGDGEVDTVAADLFKKDIVCLSEVWESAERREMLELVNDLRAAESPPLPPMYTLDEQGENVPIVGYTTGVMILTARPIIMGGVHHFSIASCTESDCLQYKGVAWARVGTSASLEHKTSITRTGPGTLTSVAIDDGEFVDVFCSHVNAGENTAGPDTTGREMQFKDMAAYIAQVRAGGPLDVAAGDYAPAFWDQFPAGTWAAGLDRPAFLMGDLNTIGPKGPDELASDFEFYVNMMGANGFRLDTPTDFEKTNSLFSDEHDLARTVTGPVPRAGGTWLAKWCGPIDGEDLAGMQRIDYVLAFPPAVDGSMPAYALKLGSQASVDPHCKTDPFCPGLGGGFYPTPSCLSDHANVNVNVELVKVSDTLKYNKAKPHHVSYHVTKIEDLETDEGCCADWYSPRVVMVGPGGSKTNEFLTASESSTPGWHVETGGMSLPDVPANTVVPVLMTMAAWEADSSSADDHYDCIPEGGAGTTSDDRDAHFMFDPDTGMVRRVRGESPASDWTVELEFLGTFEAGYADGMGWQTQGKDTESEDNALVHHQIRVTEVQ